MTIFVRLLSDRRKAEGLAECCSAFRSNANEPRIFDISESSFKVVPGAPFSYWVSEDVRQIFKRFPAFESDMRTVKQGLATADDFRFVRVWWEVSDAAQRWRGFAKGGSFSRFYADVPAVVNWEYHGKEMKAWADPLYGNSGWSRILKSTDYYGRPGLTWPLRGITFSAQAVPRDCVFSIAGKMAFAPVDELAAWLALFNSRPFNYLSQIFAGKVGGVQYEVGLVGGLPAPSIERCAGSLSNLACQGWRARRTLASIVEISHAFVLPAALRARLGDYDPPALEAELARVEAEINDIAFNLYGFSTSDRAAAKVGNGAAEIGSEVVETYEGGEGEEDEITTSIDHAADLLSWAVGVAFGRFDWRLATGERVALPEPRPFDSLPTKSPGMLPDGVAPFHAHFGILLDEPGHPHDLARLMEEVLAHVDAPVPQDVRRWLQREFFPFHLQQYSKSRRRAPIYWPLAIASAGYTLWLYYPDLNSETLFTAVNDFIEPKLEDVGKELAALRSKGSARSRDDDKAMEALQTLEKELVELRDTLMQIAPIYRPCHDDGVQITAAPLWRLFRQKPWQKLLKETWAKLEKGDYDWAHLAMAYWPDRVREKCRTDKSLAIAHGLEELYEPPPENATGAGRGGRKRRGPAP